MELLDGRQDLRVWQRYFVNSSRLSGKHGSMFNKEGLMLVLV